MLVWTASPTVGHSQSADELDVSHPGIDLEAIQGLLAVQQLDAWLLTDYRGRNPIATSVLEPQNGPLYHRWLYWLPAEGAPVLLVHQSEVDRFSHIQGQRREYSDYRSFESELRELLRKNRRARVAMEYSPNAELIELSLVDAGTVELVRGFGVRIRSSAALVQATQSIWEPTQRLSHYVAVHHLAALLDAVTDHIAETVQRGEALDERGVQTFILRGYEIRGLVGPPPRIASAVNTADPHYRTPSEGASAIATGDLVRIEMTARQAGNARAVYATMTWMVYVGERVPPQMQSGFAALVAARESALSLIRERVERRRPVMGYEVDREARRILEEAGYGTAVLHRTGHGLDTSLLGNGAKLDDYESRDTRPLMVGTGFVIQPSIYIQGQFGMRTSVDVYISRTGVETTTPQQQRITALWGRKRP